MFSEFYATVPALDTFVTMEKSQRIRNFLEVMTKKRSGSEYISCLRNLVSILISCPLSNLQSLVVGDVIFAQVMGKSAAGLLLKVLCNCSDCPRVVTELGVKVCQYIIYKRLCFFFLFFVF